MPLSNSDGSLKQRTIPEIKQRENPKPKSRRDKKWKEMDTLERLVTVYRHASISASIGM